MAFEKLLHFPAFAKYAEAGARDEPIITPLSAARALSMALLAGLLGTAGTVFSCYPFGMALLAAVDRQIPAVFAGLLVSSLFSPGSALALAVVYTASLLLRAAVCRVYADVVSKNAAETGGKPSSRSAAQAKPGGAPLFSEPVLLRLTVSAFTAFVFGLWRLITGGFLYYDLFGLLTAFFLCPALTLALSMIFTRDERFAPYSQAGYVTLMFMVIFSLSGVKLFGFSPAYIAALIAALCAASAGSGRDAGYSSCVLCGLRGCAVGLIAGLACGGELGYAPTLIAASGLAAGLLWRVSRWLSTAAVCLVTMILGLPSQGFAALTTVLPDTLGAVTVFLPLSYYNLLPKLPLFAQPAADRAESAAAIAEKRQADTVQRMSSLSEALGRLSEIIYTLSDRLRRPGIIDLKQLCDGVFDCHCGDCAKATLCLERECTSTLDAQSKITTELYKNGRVGQDSLPDWLRSRCHKLDSIVTELNEGCAELVEGLIKTDKTEAFAVDYDALSRLLADSIAENEAEYSIDPELTKRLQREMRYMDMPGARAICWGNRRKQVTISGVEPAGMRLGADELRRMIENTLHTKLTRPKFRIDGEQVEVSMTSRRRYSVESAQATSVKESESANGDTAVMFENREDYFYTLISDGMGSGREAAVTSRLCGVFVEQLLAGGNGKAVTLEMLNGFLRQRQSECSATVDLVEIDLLSGSASFVKSGAAPSFVLRGGNLYKLQSKTVPIGIMPALDAEQIKFDLSEGDIIVMLSDGVAQSLEDGVWLANLLTYEWQDDLELMAEKIIDNASLNNARNDDMTAVLLRVGGFEE